MKRMLAVLIVIAVALGVSLAAFAQQPVQLYKLYKPGMAATQARPVNVVTITLSPTYSITTGVIGKAAVNVTTIKLSPHYEFTMGRIGVKRVELTAVTLSRSFKFTTGSLGLLKLPLHRK